MFAGGVVQCHNQIPFHPPGHPLMGAAILMQHHARQRRAFTSFARLALGLTFFNQSRLLQPTFDPGAASSCVSRFACQPVYASSNRIFVTTQSDSSATSSTTMKTGQLVCYKSGQFICSLRPCRNNLTREIVHVK